MAAAETIYTREQVAQHKEQKDGWIIINNHVYDVSHFYDDHPGGRDVLLAKIGGDATEDFEAVHHSKSALRKMHTLCIGALDASERRTFITREQVRQKTTADGAWFVISNKVYDVTDFLDHHPGGRDVLLWHAGTDATQAFVDNGHSDMAYKMMQKYFIGDVDPSERTTDNARGSHTGGSGAASKAQASGQAAPKQRRSGDASLAQRIATQLKIAVCVIVFGVVAAYLLS